MIGTDLKKRRNFGAALLHRERAARVKAAPFGKRRRIGHESLDGAEALLLEVQPGDRAEQPDRVGMLRLREEPLGSANMLGTDPGSASRRPSLSSSVLIARRSAAV